MSATGLEVFDTTLQKTNTWLRQIMDELGTDDRHVAYGALRATLHALRDRLTPNEAVHFGAQLPMLVRGLYYEGWHLADKPYKASVSEFLHSISTHFGRGVGIAEAQNAAHAVFRVLDLHITPGELADIKRCLPAEFSQLW